MTDIFISYAHEDQERVGPIVKELEKHGWSVFWDRKIPPGKTWRFYLKEKLDESSCVLVVWSRDSIKSKWIHAEADEADKRDILVPLFLDAVEPPFGFSHIQAADLSYWNNNSSYPAFQDLITAIESHVSSSPSGVIELDPDTVSVQGATKTSVQETQNCKSDRRRVVITKTSVLKNNFCKS
jgi:sulfatase modifying factor 1